MFLKPENNTVYSIQKFSFCFRNSWKIPYYVLCCFLPFYSI